MDDGWPDIPYTEWEPTCAALHLYCQMVGKYRLAHTPWVNHSWHATLYVNAAGLTTGLVPDGPGISVQFDLMGARLVVVGSPGDEAGFALGPMTVAEFDRQFRDAIRSVGGTPTYHGRPNELPAAVPFASDHQPRPWDGDAVRRFHDALVHVAAVFERFRTGFIGKASPVHLFWGSFDLAVTRFSGRRAPLHPGGIANLPDAVTREAYSHEVSSAGFWPGGGGVNEACFYSYAYPAPRGFPERKIFPSAARFDSGLGEYLLPYTAVQRSDDPAATLMGFLASTYRAAADCGGWDTTELECEIGVPRVPRPIRSGSTAAVPQA